MENHEKFELPPEGMNADDLASTLLYHMQVGRNQANMVAAAEALLIKSRNGLTIPKAYEHIVLRWRDYKGSDHYRSKFRLSAAKFLSEGDYDNPALWGGVESHLEVISSKLDPVAEMRALKRDRELHPEKYVTPQEIADLFKSIKSIKTKKRMPARLADIRPFTINPDLNREKLEAQAELLMHRDAINHSTVGYAGTLDLPKNNIPLQNQILESMARDEQQNSEIPGNGQVVDPASPIRPGPNGLSYKLFE